MEPADPGTKATAYLVVRRDAGFDDVFPLTPGQTCSLGRAASNCIVLKDDLCSREHAEVSAADGRWRLRDLNSLNGTRLNGAAVEGERELAPNDEVQLGQTCFLFVEDLGQLPGPTTHSGTADGLSTADPDLVEDQPMPTGIEGLRDEFHCWMLRRGGILRMVSVHSTPAYLSLRRIHLPETKWFGAMGKCCHYVDALIGACLKTLLPIAGEHGVAVIGNVAAGKPLDRLTLGQQVQILEALDAALSRAFWQLYPDVMPHSREVEGGRLLGRSGVAMLHQLSRMRNDFAHGRWQQNEAEKEQFVRVFPTAVSDLCQSRLVFAAMALESSGFAGDTPNATTEATACCREG